MKSKLSILMLTIDRYEITKKTLENNLRNIDVDYELLVRDNGSKDIRVFDFIKNIPQLSFFSAGNNKGVASSFNLLMSRCKGTHICLMGNDILMPLNWASEMVKYSEGVKSSGLIGMDWGHFLPPLVTIDGIHAHYIDDKVDRVFGTTVFSREVLDDVGYFHTGFNPYGLEDSDYNNRVNLAGRKSLYVPNMKSKHIGNDVGENSEYRKMKDVSLNANTLVYKERVNNYKRSGYYEPYDY